MSGGWGGGAGGNFTSLQGGPGKRLARLLGRWSWWEFHQFIRRGKRMAKLLARWEYCIITWNHGFVDLEELGQGKSEEVEQSCCLVLSCTCIFMFCSLMIDSPAFDFACKCGSQVSCPWLTLTGQFRTDLKVENPSKSTNPLG